MAVRRLFVPRVEVGELRVSGDEGHYALHVLRLGVGASVTLIGEGGEQGDAVVIAADRSGLAVRVSSLGMAPAVQLLGVLLGLPKPALVEEALQLGTEAGVTDFWLAPSQFSPPGRPREDRLLRVVDAAVRQCRRPDRPRLHLQPNLAEALAALPEGHTRVLAAPEAPRAQPAPGGGIAAVGPEGGFSEAEVATLLAAGFQPAGLGPHILRAPTAVALAAALIRS